jgi:pyruvate ferredoxin oxidoreductase gamma subunit
VFQVRIHGRGGQGVVTAAELLSLAAFADGRFAQAFPTFGSERMGAPVISFCRIDDSPIRSREPVVEPDALVVQDATLVHQVDLFAGLGAEAYVVINTARALDELGLDKLVRRFRAERVVGLPASDMAREHLGRPLPNAVLLGALAAVTGVVSLQSLTAAIRDRFPGETGTRNAAAAAAGFADARATRAEVHVA